MKKIMVKIMIGLLGILFLSGCQGSNKLDNEEILNSIEESGWKVEHGGYTWFKISKEEEKVMIVRMTAITLDEYSPGIEYTSYMNNDPQREITIGYSLKSEEVISATYREKNEENVEEYSCYYQYGDTSDINATICKAKDIEPKIENKTKEFESIIEGWEISKEEFKEWLKWYYSERN